MPDKLDKHILRNGMVLLGEPMAGVESAAFVFMLPTGAACLPKGCCGAANIIADWIFRGAGDKNNRQLNDALDGIGLHRTSSVSSSHLTVGAVLEATNLTEALNLYADIILVPQLQDEQFEPAKQLATDRIRSLDDDPRQSVMLKLQQQFFPPPLGRSILGDLDELQVLTPEQTRKIIKDHFNLSQTIFAVAGKYNFDALCRQMERLFETDRQQNLTTLQLGVRPDKYKHIENDSAQVHLALMTATVKPADKQYYNARLATSVLSGGMSARLFTEVREKRGLCYSIGAHYHGLKEAAGIMCYAGTTPERAQETLEVIVQEFQRLQQGISQQELDRAKVGLKSSLILQSESSSSRAGGIAGDYYIWGRVRGLDEIKNKIEQTTVNSVLEFLKLNKFEDFTVVSIGPRDLNIP